MFDRQHPINSFTLWVACLLLAALLPAAPVTAQVFQGGAAARTAFDATVYPIVEANCQRCHGGSGPGFPHIAHVDAATAFRAVYGSVIKSHFGVDPEPVVGGKYEHIPFLA